MAMHRFAHASASSIEEAVDVLGESCRPIAGGTDLVALMKDDLEVPERLVNLKTIPGMTGVMARPDGLHIGALTTLSMLASDAAIASRPAMTVLVEAIGQSASPQLRHMATVGGNLLQRPRCWYYRNHRVPCWRKGGQRCFAFQGENKYHTILGGGPCYAVHPSDPGVALLALGASALLVGPRDRRTVPLESFYRLPKRDYYWANGYHPVTVLEPNEVVAEIIIPAANSAARSVYVKITERGTWDFALVSAAVSLVVSGGGVEAVSIALGGVAPVPWRARAAEAALSGKALDDDVIEQVAAASVANARPLARNRYKVDLVKSALSQALRSLR